MPRNEIVGYDEVVANETYQRYFSFVYRSSSFVAQSGKRENNDQVLPLPNGI